MACVLADPEQDRQRGKAAGEQIERPKAEIPEREPGGSGLRLRSGVFNLQHSAAIATKQYYSYCFIVRRPNSKSNILDTPSRADASHRLFRLHAACADVPGARPNATGDDPRDRNRLRHFRKPPDEGRPPARARRDRGVRTGQRRRHSPGATPRGDSPRGSRAGDAMYEFHARHGIRAQRAHGRHDANGSVVRWCFADAAIAAAFAKEFSEVENR